MMGATLGKSQSCGILRAVETITIQTTDDRYTVRETLRRVGDDQVLITLPWEIDRGWIEPLDFEVQRRVAQGRNLNVAWVIQDPARRPAARQAGFPVFKSEQAALEHLSQNHGAGKLKPASEPEQPRLPWWAPLPRKPKAPQRERPPTWLLALEAVVLLVVLGVVVVAFLLAVPSATVTLHPATITYSRIVPISVDPNLDIVDLQRGVIPSQRIGEEFEGYAEVSTSGRGFAFSGRATGQVLFTNLLGQEYRVPAGTIVRTSAGSYPVRYETTAGVTIPAFGQAQAPVQALEEGPSGNVDAYQINLVEGVVGFAVRVTNPAPIAGAESQTVRIVSQADRDRAWALAADQVMAQAYNGLQALASQEPGRFLPQQTLVIQAAPRAAYTHLVGERTDTLGLSLRLLVTGEAIQGRDAQAVAHRQLVTQLPEGYTLVDAQYQFGEAAEEDIGPGRFTFFIMARGYAAAKIDQSRVLEIVQATPVEEAAAELEQSLPLARPPEINVTPSWFPYVPFLDINTQVNVVAGQMPAP
jgi:hypothetical protein